MVRGIDLSRSMPQAEIPQKVSVGGLTVAELTQWLAQQAPAEVVKNVAVHVGVNDCLAPLSPIVTSQQWKTLTTNCQHVFPSATIKASRIVPARGRHTASTAIQHSNTNLQAVCRDMGVTFVDHAPTFTAPSGAPKMALYKDAIHPNSKGTVCLALNLSPQKTTLHISSGLTCGPTPQHNPCLTLCSQEKTTTSEQPKAVKKDLYPELYYGCSVSSTVTVHLDIELN